MKLALCTVAGFLLGSIPFSVLAGRKLGAIDIRRTGTRNPGATNVFKNVGKIAGAGVAIADAAKGAAAVSIGLAAGLGPIAAIWPGVAAVLGHDFSPFLRFRGGKGGATTLGFLACYLLPELLVVFLTWMVFALAVRKHLFVASLFALSLLPFWVWILEWSWPIPLLDPWPMIWVSSAMILLMWFRILPGLRERSRRG